MSNEIEFGELRQKIFFGPVIRDEFVTSDDWRNAIECAFDDMDDAPRIDNVKMVMAIDPGEFAKRDWIAIVRFDYEKEWWFIQAGTPGSSWSEGLGARIPLGQSPTDAANSPNIPESAFVRFLPQFLRLHTESKINLYSVPAELTNAASNDGYEAAFFDYFKTEGGE